MGITGRFRLLTKLSRHRLVRFVLPLVWPSMELLKYPVGHPRFGLSTVGLLRGHPRFGLSKVGLPRVVLHWVILGFLRVGPILSLISIPLLSILSPIATSITV